MIRIDRRYRRLPRRLSLTPLVDVIFILVMFFMLSSTFGIWRPLTIQLPQNEAAHNQPEMQSEPTALADAPATADVLIVIREVDGSGVIELQVNGSELGLSQLAERLNALSKRGAERVVISPRGEVDLQAVVTTLDVASQSRIQRISVDIR